MGNRRTGYHRTSVNSSPHTDSIWLLKELTEMAVTIEVGSLFQYFTTRTENIRLALEAASLQWMEGEKEFFMRTHRSLTTFTTCMESPGLPVARDN